MSRPKGTLVIAAIVIAVLVVAFFIFAGLYTDWLWYEQLGFTTVLATQWIAGTVMFIIGFLAMAVPVWLSIEIAFRKRPVYARLSSQLDRYQQVIEPLRRVATYGIPAVLGFFAAVAASSRWPLALQWLHRTEMGEVDPQFGLDISFYLFELPFYRSVLAFASAVVLLSAIAAVATSYLYGAIRFNGREVRISKTARIQFAVTGAIYLLLQAVSIWLDQYTTLLGSSSGLLVGASYADVNAVIPGRAILAGIAAVVAVLFIVTAIIGRWRLPIVGTALLIVAALLVGTAYPWVMQRFQVEPSARSLEAPYIERNIEATRAAYGLADVVETPYAATTDAEPGQLRDDAETTASIRILDPALVSDSFGQLQQVRQYYNFADTLDVDRYEIDGEIQDTVIAVRELNPNNASVTNSWYNSTVVYTHGFGVVAAAGNQRTPDGNPLFIESEIPSSGIMGDYEQRIYFGESSPAYSIVGAPEDSRPVELDYPSTSEEGNNATTTYAGDGGPKLDNFFKQLIFAIKFQSEQIVLSDAVNSESQILYDRDPSVRVQNVAPYLTLDSDPYPAVVDEKVVWIVDGYTTSANYPYSDVRSLRQAIVDTYTPEPDFVLDNINYIRNSVKATVDAYSGEVTLYAWDTEDPILQTWQKIFPSTLTPMEEMSDDLLAHVRYPADLFKMQREVLGTYHVTDSDSFYSGDDAWVTPNDPTSDPATAKAQPPYYLTMRLPGSEEAAFSLYSTYIPRSSGEGTRNVLTGYVAVNADAGEDYGKFTLLTLPRDSTVSGPGQAQNDFNSEATVSRELNILDQGSTTVKRGNLLTLPVGGGLLYVQPVYVQSTGETSYPVLQKVLASFGDKIAFEDSLDAALDSIFGGDSGAAAGDDDVVGSPDAPTDPTTPEQPGTETPEEPGGETPTPPGTEYEQALADARDALTEREAAYRAGDRVGAAEADERLLDALERLFELSE